MRYAVMRKPWENKIKIKTNKKNIYKTNKFLASIDHARHAVSH